MVYIISGINVGAVCDIILRYSIRETWMNIKIKDLSLEELKSFIDEAVAMRLEERFGGPDVGLNLKPEVIEEIRKSRRRRVTIPAGEVAGRLGLKWS
jgi:hypothetical protein